MEKRNRAQIEIEASSKTAELDFQAVERATGISIPRHGTLEYRRNIMVQKLRRKNRR